MGGGGGEYEGCALGGGSLCLCGLGWIGLDRFEGWGGGVTVVHYFRTKVLPREECILGCR